MFERLLVEFAVFCENPPGQIAVTGVDTADVPRPRLLDLVRGQQTRDITQISFSTKRKARLTGGSIVGPF